MKKSNHFLFTNKDEEIFSSEIRKAFPATMFIDDMRWETNIPPAKSSITECESKFVYIWNKEIYPNLPFMKRSDGKFQGPQSGMVIQMIRSRIKDEITFLSGEIATGVADEDFEMVDFVKKVWKILKKAASKKVVQVNPETQEILFERKDILVGNDAYEWSKVSEERYFKFNNNIHIYLRPL